MEKLKNKKVILILVLMLVGSFLIYGLIASADISNTIAINNISLTKIDTGSGQFDASDGLTYNDDGSINTYTAGNDSSKNNRIVRSFDTISYYFDFNIIGKDGTNPGYEDRTVNIDVTINDEMAKYIAFDRTSKAGEKKHTFKVNGVSSYGSSTGVITLYVLGAPNKAEIKPTFEIYESTDTDTSSHVILGLNSDGNYNYDYNSESSPKYTNTSNSIGFSNYLPTLVSSKQANMNLVILGQTSEGQKATYNDSVGRYLTYVVGVQIVGDSYKGIKGQNTPDGSAITFDAALSQNGTVKTLTTKESWTRLYGTETIENIEPVIVNSPYSSGAIDNTKKTKYPGSMTFTGSDSAFKGNISDYDFAYSPVGVTADNVTIQNGTYFVGTYAVSVFSPRAKEDAKNDIDLSLVVSNATVKDTEGKDIRLNIINPSVLKNKYYEVIDYSLTGAFYDEGNNKISSDPGYPNYNGTGSTSKGTNLIYKTTFNYKKTLSDAGLKEVIKFDTNAFRVIPNGEKDVKITVESESKKLSQDDFEVKFVSGSFDNVNYSAANFDDSSLDSRLNSEDLSVIKSSCTTVKNNLSKYSVNQIQNLYGGPCIVANENVENEYSTIVSAKTGEDNNTEVPITKVIVQTKDGVILPDDAKVIVEVGVRVRNVSDLTQTYQATVVATSSDYDKNLTYYAPRIGNDNNSITSPDSYNKTIYQGSNISYVDSRLWGDSLRIVNFTSRQKITVTNKDINGNVKTRYNSNSGETINYNIKTIINDNNENVGADDVWYINHLRVTVNIPKELEYVPDKKLGTPEVIMNADGSTTLIYTLPYTKPNQKIPEINFKANVSPKVNGSGVEVKVVSSVEAININGERDSSYIGYLSDSFSIYVTGTPNVIVSQKIGDEGSVIEKNGRFSYKLRAYNNTGNAVKDYTILDVLPANGDSNGSLFSGSYKVIIQIPDSIYNTAKVYCSTKDYKSLVNDIDSEQNDFVECNTNEEVDATAIKITNINIPVDSYTDDIIVTIITNGNNYSDKYVNSFIGGSQTYSKNESNKITARVISRNLSGRVFLDIDEDGIEEEGDKYLKNIPITLYKLDTEGNMKVVDDTTTNENGEYKFKDLPLGRYKIRANYDSSLYDLTLRYATEDKEHDSDAYKISESEVEISNRRTPTEMDGIQLAMDVESVSDLNIGFITKKSFGFNIQKYITKVDLNTVNGLQTYNYDNQTLVKMDVKRSLHATARIYYGIKIENDSTKAGYVKLINEDIPDGLSIDLNTDVNKSWFYDGTAVRNNSLENDLIKPGESRYLSVALDMPEQEGGREFLNTVTLLEIEEYNPEPLADDIINDPNTYTFGEAVTYGGVNWHVINVTEKDENNEQILTLVADNNVKNMATLNKNGTYKWSSSLVNDYLTNDWYKTNSLNYAIFMDNEICDDASGLSNNVVPKGSVNQVGGGGELKGYSSCVSNSYSTTKVRLLTAREYRDIYSNLVNATDKSWLGNNYWLMDSSYGTSTFDSYGNETNTNYNKLKFVNTSGVIQDVAATESHGVKPVITVSSRNVISE